MENNFIEHSIKWEELPGQTEYIEGQRLHVGNWVEDYQLSEHFTLSQFKRDGEYKVSEYLIEKLEAMFSNFTAIKSVSISSSYRTWQPGNYLSMHNIGGAVDIAWLDESGKALNAKHIAVAAAWIGFGGIAPLEKSDGNGGWYANSIHMDVRKNYSDWNSCWYGYENDPDNDGWFSSYTIPNGSNYKDPQAFYDRYNLTEAEVVAYLGGGSLLPSVTRVLVQKNDTTCTTFKALLGASISELQGQYILKSTNQDDIEAKIENSVVDPTTLSASFSISNLLPGTTYGIEFSFSVGGSSSKHKLSFTTKQDYPKGASIGSLSLNSSNKQNKKTPTKEFTTTFNIPASYECFWESYWRNLGASNYKGYTVSIISNGNIVKQFTPQKNAAFSFIPKEHGIDFGTNIQVGVQLWIKTNKKVSETTYEVLKSDQLCTNPIYLESAMPRVQFMYIKDGTKFERVMISALKENS